MLLLVLPQCRGKRDYPPLDQEKSEELQAWLDNNGMSPVEYVLSKFDEHDVVILGEPHRFKNHPLLVQKLVPRLHEKGVYILATEFARSVDQYLIDSLINAPEWNEELAIEIQLLQYSLWPWREYLDIYKAAWQYNRTNDGRKPDFRIIGINCDPDWSVMQTKDDLDNPAKRRTVWKGCSEKDWADIVLKEINEGKKALAFCGIHHAFSRYRQPQVDAAGEFAGWGDVRFGNHLYNSLGEKVFTIALHYPWYEKKSMYKRWSLRPVEGVIDAVMEARAVNANPVGFDVAGGPFGDLTDSRAIYAVGYDPFTLATFCDGYIFFYPFSETELVTFIAGFYNENNIEMARISVPQPKYRQASPEYFEKRMKRQLERERKLLSEL